MSENVSTAKKKEPGFATLVIVLAAICIVMAFLLGLVNMVTEPAIQDNDQKKINEAMAAVLPVYTDGEYTEVEYAAEGTIVTGIYQAGDMGYVVQVQPTSGFSGAIDMMVGIDASGAVQGVSIIKHAETPGLGAKATDPEWQAQFIGTTEALTVMKDGGTIQSITGSTITSRAVCEGVNAARTAVEAVS